MNTSDLARIILGARLAAEPRLALVPFPQLPAARAAAAAPRPRSVAALDLDAFQFDILLGVSVVKSNVVGAIRPDTCHFSGIELALSFKISLDPVALARLLRALRAPAAAPRTAARAAPVAPLLPRAAVGIGTGVEGFDVLGLEVFIRISIIIPMCGINRVSPHAIDAMSTTG